MKIGGIVIVTILGLMLSGCRPQMTGPTVTFELEVNRGVEIAAPDEELPLDIAGQWLGKALSSATDIGKRGIEVETVAPNLVKVTVSEIHEAAAANFLQLLDSDHSLSFHAVHPDNFSLAPQVNASGEVVPGYIIKATSESPPVPYLLKIPGVVSGSSVKSARPDHGSNGWSIIVDFDTAGAAAMGAFTSAHVNEPLAIVLGDRILSVPVIRQPFSDGAMISGSFTQTEAQSIATLLDNPPLFSFTLKTAPKAPKPVAP